MSSVHWFESNILRQKNQSVGWISPTTLATVSLTPEGHSVNEPVVDRDEPARNRSTERRTLNQYLDGA